MYARSVVRAASKAAGSAFKARAAFTTGAKLRNAEIISASEIPHTSYNSGSVQRSTIPVGDHTLIPLATRERVIPLTNGAYKNMTPMMQKMTLMDKVVIVTG